MIINPFEVTGRDGAEAHRDGVQQFVNKITALLVAEHAELIGQVEAGIVSRSVLEAEVIRTIDSLEEGRDYNREALINAAFDGIFGYGPLEPYLQDREVSDILVNAPGVVYIKKRGRKLQVPVNFGDEKELLTYCRKVVAICGGRINENEAEVVVTDRKRNLRIVISIAPVNVGSPSVVIRKPTTDFSLSELLKSGMLDEEMAEHLSSSVRTRETTILAGKGGSGKTTLLGALLNQVPPEERGLLIQETSEITVQHPDIICQLIKQADSPEAKAYTLFDLTRCGLLMSLDRMFIGELKDREAFDFFNAVFTGHRGSMATVHANSAEETLDRLVLLMKRAAFDLPGEYLKELLAASLDQVIFMNDYKIYNISQVIGYDRQQGTVRYHRLFVYDEKTGGFVRTGEPVKKGVASC